MSYTGAALQTSEQSAAYPSQDGSIRRKLGLSCILLLITVVVYFPVLHHPFFNLDDGLYVVHNEHVREGLSWKTVKWSFTAFDRSNWVPLSFVSHALDYQIFGDDPSGHHAVNLALQALNAVLLFWVLQAATGSMGRSFMVSALFALHPLNVEATVWIAERKTVLSMVFFLLALGAYRWYARQPGIGRYAVVALLFSLGLCAKAQVIVLPAALLLWDYWPLQRMFPPPEANASANPSRTYPARSLLWLVLEKLPLLVLCGVDAVFTIRSEHEARLHLWPPLSERLGNAVYSYARYIEKAFWPSAMAPLYPNPGNMLSRVQIGGACCLLLVITALVVYYRRHRYLPMGWFWFLGTLVPMMQIVQFGKEGMADRFAYQALIGLFVMVCWGLADCAQQWRISPKWLLASGLAVLLVLSVITRRQVGYWRDDLTLWRHAASVVPGHWQAEDNIGVALLRQGNPESVALPHFFRAVQIHPTDPVSNMHVAIYDQQNGKLREAIAHYDEVLLTPAPPDVDAQIYQNEGLAYTALGDKEKAKECFDRAISLRNNVAAAMARPER